MELDRGQWSTAGCDFGGKLVGAHHVGVFVPSRAHLIALRDDLRARLTQSGERWSDASIRYPLSALAALFEYLCSRNAATHNPVNGVERPKSESGEGKISALGDHQARKLLAALLDDGVCSKRDRAILSTPLFHALRREELCKSTAYPQRRAPSEGVGHRRQEPLDPGKQSLSFMNSRRPSRGRRRSVVPAGAQQRSTRRTTPDVGAARIPDRGA